MALIRFGNGVSEIRGSIAGTTFSRNRAGAVARNRIKPINPNTQQQADVRYLFATIAAQFADLNQAQKDVWTDFAAALTFWRNRLGEPYTPSARQVYQYCTTNLILAASSLNQQFPVPSWYWVISAGKIVPDMALTEKPTPPQFDNGNKFMGVSLGTGGTISGFSSDENLLPPNAADDVQAVIVEATEPLRPSQKPARNSFKYLQGFGAATAAPLSIGDEYNIRFNSPAGLVAGMKVIVRVSTVNKNGLRSDPVEIHAVVG
jgi:hypothetical protein